MKIGTLMIEMAANVARLQKDMQRATRTVDGAMAKIQKASQVAVRALGALGLGIGAVQFGQLIRQTALMSDELSRFAQLANMSTRDFQKISIAAQRFGVSQEKVADVLKDVQDKVGDFLQTGAGPMVDFFEQIAPKVGVTAEQFRRLNGREALQLYVSSLERANLSQADMVFYMEAIASDSTLLLPLLKQNGKAYNEIAAEAQKFGQIIDDDVIKANKALNQDLMRLGAAFEGLKNRALAPIIPALQAMADSLLEAFSSGAIKSGIENLITLFKALAIVITARVAAGLVSLTSSMAANVVGMNALQLSLTASAVKMKAFAVAAGAARGALALLGGPMGLLFTGASALIYFAGRLDDSKKAAEEFNDSLDRVASTFSNLETEARKDSLTAAAQAYVKQQVKVLEIEKELNKVRANKQQGLAGLHDQSMDSIRVSAALEKQLKNERLEASKASDVYFALAQAHTAVVETKKKEEETTEEIIIATQTAAEKVQELIESYKLETQQLTMSNAEKERSNFLQSLLNEGIKKGSEEWNKYVDQFSLAQLERQTIESQIAYVSRQKELDRQRTENLIEQQKEFAREAQKINDQVGQSLTDALMNGGRSAKEYLVDLFRTMVLRPILQPIMSSAVGALGLGTAGASMAGTGGAAGGSTMSNLLGISQLASAANSLYGIFAGGISSTVASGIASLGSAMGSAAVSQFAAGMAGATLAPGVAGPTTMGATGAMGAGAVAGAALPILAGVGVGLTGGTLISGKYSLAGDQMVSTGVGTAIGAGIGTAILPGIGTAIGAALGGIVGGVVNRAFGKGPKETQAAGITGSIGFGGADIRNFRDWSRSGGWFSSGSSGTDITGADPVLVDYLNSQLNTIGGSIGVLAETIGYSSAHRYIHRIYSPKPERP